MRKRKKQVKLSTGFTRTYISRQRTLFQTTNRSNPIAILCNKSHIGRGFYLLNVNNVVSVDLARTASLSAFNGPFESFESFEAAQAAHRLASAQYE